MLVKLRTGRRVAGEPPGNCYTASCTVTITPTVAAKDSCCAGLSRRVATANDTTGQAGVASQGSHRCPAHGRYLSAEISDPLCFDYALEELFCEDLQVAVMLLASLLLFVAVCQQVLEQNDTTGQAQAAPQGGKWQGFTQTYD